MADESALRREALIREVEIQNRAKTIAVPTNDTAVRQRLRQLHEPITLFGEKPEDRRERLRLILATLEAQGVKVLDQEKRTILKSEEEKPELFFTEGTTKLKSARLFIAQYSLPRAMKRVEEQRKIREVLDAENYDGVADILDKKKMCEEVKMFANTASQIGDNRPLFGCCLTPDGKYVLTGAMSGSVKLWDASTCKLVMNYKGHLERVTGVAANPDQNSKVAFASGAADNLAKLWTRNDPSPIADLEGHTNRLARIAFHPSGRFLGVTSYDGTWSFWDLSEQEPICLVEQEGHSSGVYAIAFQCDGALCATADVGGIIRVWDLRTGRTVMPLTGHVRQILSLDFSPNGFQLASTSEDRSVRFWDLRKKRCFYTLPAHSKLISYVKFEPHYGRYFLTAAYDHTMKLWTSNEFQKIKTLTGHENKITCADIAQDGSMIVSCGFDRTFKIWKKEKILDL